MFALYQSRSWALEWLTEAFVISFSDKKAKCTFEQFFIRANDCLLIVIFFYSYIHPALFVNMKIPRQIVLDFVSVEIKKKISLWASLATVLVYKDDSAYVFDTLMFFFFKWKYLNFWRWVFEAS